MELTELEKLLLIGLKNAGLSMDTACTIMLSLPLEAQQFELADWMVWYLETYGVYPPKHLYPEALRPPIWQLVALSDEVRSAAIIQPTAVAF